MKFQDLKLRPELQKQLDEINFQDTTPIQELAIPIILEGKDLFGLAQTGTGKTAAFLLPLMERILCAKAPTEGLPEEDEALIKGRYFPEWKKNHFCLVLVPTRELAEQVYQDVYRLRGSSALEGVAIYGGTSYEGQKEKLQQGVEFVIGTPGRLIDLYKSHVVDLRQVRAVVFDEADRMFDMGFKDDMKYLLQRIPKDRQVLMFSATLNFDVLHTAYHFGADPVECNVSRDQAKAENVKDEIFHCGSEEKPKFLLSLFKRENPRQTIVFSNFKHNVERVARFLSENGCPAMAISSLLTQSQRNRVIEQFKAENEKNILVATDVAARGLDIKGVDMVINYELPDDAENYVHRIGRTGRAGATGRAFSLVGDRDVEALMRIEEYLKHKVEIGWMEDKDLIGDFKPFPVEGGFRREGGTGNDKRPSRGGPRGPRRDGDRPGGRGPGGPRAEGGPRGERGPRAEGRRDRSGGRPDRTRSERNYPDRNRQSGDPANAQAGTSAGGTAGASGASGVNGENLGATGSPRREFHRDRRTGRHNGPQAGGGSSPSARGRDRHGGRPNSGRGADRQSSRGGVAGGRHAKGRPGSHRPGSSPSTPSLINKVSSFFKKLFS